MKTPRSRGVFHLGRRLAARAQMASVVKITNHTIVHSGIDRPTNLQSTLEQLPVPAKIFGSACVSGKLPSRKSRSLPQLSVFGGKCCRKECRDATPAPNTEK